MPRDNKISIELYQDLMDIADNALDAPTNIPFSARLHSPAFSAWTGRDEEQASPAISSASLPPLTLVLGAAGAGKTEWAMRRFVEAWNTSRPVLLIVSSPQQAQTRAEQLAALLHCAPADVLPGLRAFRQLASELTADLLQSSAPDASQDEQDFEASPYFEVEDDERAAPPNSEHDGCDEQSASLPVMLRPIGRAFQRLALADLFPNTIRPDDFLGRMLRAPGFVPALSERVREWKLACLTPDVLEQAGPALAGILGDPTFPRKTGELARLFHAYQAFLRRNNLRDDEDTLRLAVEGIRARPVRLPNDAACVIVDGFYRFNPMQRHLLSALAASVHSRSGADIEVAVTLPYEAARPLLFAAPARTLALLRHEFQCRETTLARRAPARLSSLALLGDRLFGTEGERGRGGEGKAKLEPEHSKQGMQGAVSNEIPSASSCPPLLPSPPLPPPSSVFLFDAPNPYVEAEMVARQFRRLYDGGGYAWSDFAVILRAMGDYAPILAAVFERHGIPLGVDGPEILAENPFIKTLLFLLTVLRRNWQRDDVLAFLKSSYTAPAKLEADRLRRRARKAGVREDRDRWLGLVAEDGDLAGGTGASGVEMLLAAPVSAAFALTLDAALASSNAPASAAAPLVPSIAATLRDMAYYDALFRQEKRDPRQFADLIEEVVNTFGLAARIEEGEPTRQERDRAAWSAARETLRALAQMAALSGRRTMTFDAFYDELSAAWQGASSIAIAHGDMVRVAEPYDSRERPLKVAAVMGLTERVFPRRVTEDPFLRDEERAALREWAGLDLEEQKGRSDDERFFFYLAVTAPSEHLILSYPRSADESDTLPSFYLDEVRRVFAKEAERAASDTAEFDNASENPRHTLPVTSGLVVVSRTLADVAPRPEEAVSDSDRLLAACAGLFDPKSAEGADKQGWNDSLALLQSCLNDTSSRDVLRRVVTSRGLPRLPRLEDLALRRAFAASRKVFSVSELESYGRCPFQYYLRHVLRLQPDVENDHARAQGTMLHSVLHRYFAKRKTEEEKRERGEEKTTAGEEFAEMREALQRILAELLAQQPMDVSPHQARMTHRLLADALDGFVNREEKFGPQWGFAPAHFELAFGFGTGEEGNAQDDHAGAGWDDDERGPLVSTPAANAKGTGMGGDAASPGIVISGRVYDPASSPHPLLLNVTDGGAPVAICGTLDRVDLDASGRRALIMDYKLGSPPEYGAIQRGQSLQMPLYLLAVERVFNKVGAVACYDSARETGRRRFHRSEHVSQRQFSPLAPLEDGTMVTPLNRSQYADLLKTAEATAIRLARAIVDGNIEATPGDHCRACAYRDVCRSANGVHDGETIPIVPLQSPQTRQE